MKFSIGDRVYSSSPFAPGAGHVIACNDYAPHVAREKIAAGRSPFWYMVRFTHPEPDDIGELCDWATVDPDNGRPRRAGAPRLMPFAPGDRVRVVGTDLYGHVAAHLTPLLGRTRRDRGQWPRRRNP